MKALAILVFIFVLAGFVYVNVLYRRENKRRENLPESERQRLDKNDEAWRQTFQP